MKLRLYAAKFAFILTILIFFLLTTVLHLKHVRSLLPHSAHSPELESPPISWRSSRQSEIPDKTHISRSLLTTNQRDYCERSGSDDIIPSRFRRLFVNDEHKIIYCSVPKIACTNWGRVFLILSGKMNTTNLKDIESRDVHGKFKPYFKLLRDYSPEEIKYRLDNYYKFMFTREPLERVLSAYLDKFKKSNPYFASRFGKKIVNRFRVDPGKSKGNDVKFPEFVQYITDDTRREAPNEHWQKMTDLCQPCVVNYDFVGSMENMDSDSEHVINHLGLSDKIQFPQRSLRYTNPRTRSLLRSFYSRLAPALFDQLMKEYEPDFLMFNLSVPVELRKLTRWIVKY